MAAVPGLQPVLAELDRRYRSLTPRERDVMKLVVAGRLNKQIAAELGTSEITVKVHRAHVMQTMKAGSLAELVRFVERLGPASGADSPTSPTSVAAARQGRSTRGSPT